MMLINRNGNDKNLRVLKDMFNASPGDSLLNFKFTKTRGLFCNRLWCGHAPILIKSLLKLGYPSHSFKYYRGRMLTQELLTLTTMKPEN